MTTASALADDAPHLLVVDDDRRIRDLLSRFLHGAGYRVTTAVSAADARGKLGDGSLGAGQFEADLRFLGHDRQHLPLA